MLWTTVVDLEAVFCLRIFFSSTICGLQVKAMTCIFRHYSQPVRLVIHTGTHRLPTVCTACRTAYPHLITQLYFALVVARVEHVLDGVAAPRNGDGLPL
jgi:hypothetical protein